MVGGRLELLSQIDAVTVRLLQSRAPGVSARDLGFLNRKKDRLFRYIECQRERDDIWEILKHIDIVELVVSMLRQFAADKFAPVPPKQSLPSGIKFRHVPEAICLSLAIKLIGSSPWRGLPIALGSHR
jgi:hypothetical protein